MTDFLTKLPTIAIDGHSASGKGTLSRLLGEALHFAVLDTGKLYRLIGVKAYNEGIDLDDERKIAFLAEQLKETMSADDLEDPRLKSDFAGKLASKTSKFGKVRDALLKFQKDFAIDPPATPGGLPWKGAILDGRDIGTVILPDATMKFYVTASVEVRAERRFQELAVVDPRITREQVYLDMVQRDTRDEKRAVAPLAKAEDAIEIDTSDMSIDDVVAETLKHVKSVLEVL